MTEVNDVKLDLNRVPALLLVDDEKSVLSSLRRLFRKLDCEVTLANSGKEGLEKLSEQTFDLIISDARMPEMSGPEFLAIVAEKYPETERILLTGYADMEATIDAINLGRITHYIEKPWDDKKLVDLVKQCFSVADLKNHNLYLQSMVAKQNEQLKTVNTSLEKRVQERTLELEKSHEQLKNIYQKTIGLFASLLDQRKRASKVIHVDIVDVVGCMAKDLKLDDAEQDAIKTAAALRYIGQLGMRDTLLDVAIESMSKEQKDEYSGYPLRGSMLLSSMLPLKRVSEIIAQHKEYINGKGFPKKDFGDRISVSAQIVNVANDFFELINGRFQDDKLTSEEAVRFIESRVDDYYSSELVTLLKMYVVTYDDQSFSEERLWLAQLEPGMELSRDLFGMNDSLLLTKNSVLGDDQLSKLADIERESGFQLAFYIKSV